MDDLTIPKEEVQPYSYVAVAQGSKRHNMAKVYAGFTNTMMKLFHQKNNNVFQCLLLLNVVLQKKLVHQNQVTEVSVIPKLF